MREISSFLIWLVVLTGSVLILHWILSALSLPGDIQIMATILPMVVALILLEYQGTQKKGRAVLAWTTGFLLIYITLIFTTFLLTLGN